MKKKQKCYIYTRVSTAVQVDGYSLDAQRDKLTNYAEYQDMEVVKEFSDVGHSGKNINGRPEFSRMLEDIANGEDGADFVLVFKLAQVKQKHGIIERENYNKPKSPDSRQPGCPEEKVKAIEDAMRHFQMI